MPLFQNGEQGIRQFPLGRTSQGGMRKMSNDQHEGAENALPPVSGSGSDSPLDTPRTDAHGNLLKEGCPGLCFGECSPENCWVYACGPKSSPPSDCPDSAGSIDRGVAVVVDRREVGRGGYKTVEIVLRLKGKPARDMREHNPALVHLHY